MEEQASFEQQPPLEHFEKLSELLVKTSEMAEKYEKGEVVFDTMHNFLRERYQEHDSESYDCHSFLLTILKKELGLPVITAPEFNMPDRKKYKYSTEWQETLVDEIKKMFGSVEGQQYKTNLGQFTENIYKNSEHISIPKTPITDDISVDKCQATAQDIVRQALGKFNSIGGSRIVFISDGRGDNFYDVHSTFILGVAKGGKDLWVLEKEEVGSSVSVKKLSEVIQTYSLGWQFKDLELNICNRPIGELYPKLV